ncbi:hypothetical protein ACIGO9_26745 [Nocardia asteroides]|uniref:hypothetical protein n=1 Tax=Nocardia asteroides TaxID=1824 RepID=UPI0037C9838A
MAIERPELAQEFAFTTVFFTKDGQVSGHNRSRYTYDSVEEAADTVRAGIPPIWFAADISDLYPRATWRMWALSDRVTCSSAAVAVHPIGFPSDRVGLWVLWLAGRAAEAQVEKEKRAESRAYARANSTPADLTHTGEQIALF